ncbi:hypothetical protein JKP88DRAFT_348233 [Tribonema minus]|uniref:Origin recognition complex subunit 1 n=1 Tax=Tribonema minus TaxID=303371 RepID=A0A835Z2H1_9STRA|nr:hypothetical protein JKP88DRAFT_348233 [Tribonema minus]
MIRAFQSIAYRKLSRGDRELKPWWSSAAGDDYFNRLERAGEAYSVGDAVLLRTEKWGYGQFTEAPACITYIWRQADGEMMIEAQWLYTWHDVPVEVYERHGMHGRQNREPHEVFETDHVDEKYERHSMHGRQNREPHEVFETDHMDEMSAECIERHVNSHQQQWRAPMSAECIERHHDMSAECIERHLDVLSHAAFLRWKVQQPDTGGGGGDSIDDYFNSDNAYCPKEDAGEGGADACGVVRFCRRLYSIVHKTFRDVPGPAQRLQTFRDVHAPAQRLQRLQRARLYSKRHKLVPLGLDAMHTRGSGGSGGGSNGKREREYNALMRRLQLSSAPAKLPCREMEALSSAPAKLPCREMEAAEVEAFIRDALNTGGPNVLFGGPNVLFISGVPGSGKTATIYYAGGPNVLFISGVPGTGKTATVHRVINGMKLSDPLQVYTQLWEGISGDRAKAGGTSTSTSTAPIVLLLDEVDSLATRQQVLHALFNWPPKSGGRLVIIAIANTPNLTLNVNGGGRLVIIAIANTLNLTDRYVPLIQSRVRTRRLPFRPYTRQEVELIVQDRLGEVDAFERDAVGIVSRKVAVISGDIRRAMQLCRRSLELCLERVDRERQLQVAGDSGKEPNCKVTIRDVQLASREDNDGPLTKMLVHGTPLERMLMVAVAKAKHLALDKELVSFEDVMSRLRLIANQVQGTSLPPGELKEAYLVPSRQIVLDTVYRLAHCDMLRLRKLDWHRTPHMVPKMELVNIAVALRRDPMARQHLPEDLTKGL